MFLELLILHIIAGGISLFGGLMMWRHQTQWKLQQVDERIEAGEKRFLHSQYRRRMQSSGMIVAVGLLLHASNEHLVAWERAPAGFVVYVCIMLVLVGWIVLLALSDFLANQIVHRMALTKLHAQQRELEQAALKLRQQKDA